MKIQPTKKESIGAGSSLRTLSSTFWSSMPFWRQPMREKTNLPTPSQLTSNGENMDTIGRRPLRYKSSMRSLYSGSVTHQQQTITLQPLLSGLKDE